MTVRFDEIGYWSELKLEIIRKYAAAYSRILAAQRNLFHLYVDAFAGPGMHVSKTTGELVAGSPMHALQIEPPFKEYHFIDLDGSKVAELRKLVQGRSQNVTVYEGDCNVILLQDVFPKVQYKDFRRALVLLDPYGLDLRWEVIKTAGGLGTIDMFLNFPVMDMNRNVLWIKPEGVDSADIERMNAFWGDNSWRQAAYYVQPTLFGGEDQIKASTQHVVNAFRDRLHRVAGFRRVPDPLPMRNSQRAIVYYLFFASQNDTADHIIRDIFEHYQTKGV